MKRRWLAVLLLAGFLFTGCSTRYGAFSVYSTRKMNLGRETHRIDMTRRVRAVDRHYRLLILPLGRPTMDDAADRAISAVPGCVGLSDVVVSEGRAGFLLGTHWFVVEGNPIFPRETSEKGGAL